MLNAAGDKSFVDDLAASGYCKCESSLCCYEALRFIPCFYDLFFFVFKISTCDICVCKNRRPFTVGSAFPFLPFKKSVCQYGASHFCQSGIGETGNRQRWREWFWGSPAKRYSEIPLLFSERFSETQSRFSDLPFFFRLNALESAY